MEVGNREKTSEKSKCLEKHNIEVNCGILLSLLG